MSEQENLAIVRGIYEAFGRGDLPGVLGYLADDVEWTFQGPSDVPLFGQRRGREQVAEFFTVVGETEDIEQFEPKDFVAQAEYVIVVGRERITVKATGRSFAGEWVHVYTLQDGKVARLHLFADTAAAAAAFRGA